MRPRPVTEKLKHPSVIEAVCELRFTETVSYTVIAGGMRERLRGTYPSIELLPAANVLGGMPDTLPAQMPFHRFKSLDSRFIVQTGPRLLAVNVLPQYPDFEVFRTHILEAVEHYKLVAEPRGLDRLGLRYINHLRSQHGERHIPAYLRVNVEYPNTIGNNAKETSVRLIFPQGDLGELAVAISVPATIAGGESGALLDLDLYKQAPGGSALDEFPEWLDEAHDVIHRNFVSLVAPEVMKQMKGED